MTARTIALLDALSAGDDVLLDARLARARDRVRRVERRELRALAIGARVDRRELRREEAAP